MGAAKKLLLLVVLPLAVLCAALEGIGHLLTPAAPTTGIEGRTLRFSETFYEPDPRLVARLRSGLDANFKQIRPDIDVPVHTNSEGFRGGAFPPVDPDAFRVLVLGDSVTFGLHLPLQDTWPVRLERSLTEALAARQAVVRNLGVPGYSSVQGRILYSLHAESSFAPHLVIFAFGFNDSFFRGVDDEQTIRGHAFEYGTPFGAIVRTMRKSRFLSLLMTPKTTGAEAGPCRVPPALHAATLNQVADLAAAHGHGLLLVNACLPNGYPHATMARIAKQRSVPFLDLRHAFTRAQQLEPARPWQHAGTVRVAVHTHGAQVPDPTDGRPKLSLLVVADPADRRATTTLVLADDGVAPDTKRGDGIWSAQITLPAGSTPEFALCAPGFGRREMTSDTELLNGVHFLSLDPPGPSAPGEVRDVTVLTFNMAPWNEMLIPADHIHPAPAGSALIAAVMADAVRATDAWKTFNQ